MSREIPIRDRVEELSPSQRQWLADELTALAQGTHPAIEPELVAWIVTEGVQQDDHAIRREMIKHLPSRLVPQKLIRVDSLPKTSTGKIDRKRLANDDILANKRPSVPSIATTESERKLIQVCQRLLRITDIAPQDSFMLIGGDSLLSIQLISLARRKGLEIEPRDILRCESIAELAAASDRRTGAGSDLSPQKAADEPVVSKVRSSPREGSILLVHEVGGRCHYAHYLAADLAPELTLFVSNQPPPNKSPKSIAALATLYADAWQDAQPYGPKILVAFCWGGLLAYEIVRQLKRRGQPLDMLLIIESGTESAYEHAPGISRARDRMKGLMIRVRDRFASLNNPGDAGRLIRTVAAKLTRRRSPPLTADAGFQFRDGEGDPSQIRANVQAFLDYAIQPETLPMHLFRINGPAKLIGTRYSDHSLGWRYLVGQDLTVHSISGTHDCCMQPPHVGKLAAQLNRLIAEAT